MKKIIHLNETKLREIISLVLEQTEEEYHKISPEYLKELLATAAYHPGVTKLKMFGGKPLWVTGSLNLRNTNMSSLGNIGYVEGSLDISDTKIKDLGITKVKGHIWDSGTPIAKAREAAILKQKMDEANERRENGEWNLDVADEIGLKAHALFNYLVADDEIETLTDEEKTRLNELKGKLEEINSIYDSEEDSERYNELYDEISELENEIEELEQKNIDVYNICPMGGRHGFYGLTEFEVIGVDDLRGNEYTVGDEDEMEEAALEYSKNLIDDVGIGGFNRSFIEDYIDEDSLKSMLEDNYYYDVRESPDSYFNEDDYELTDKQKARITQLETFISDSEEYITNLEEKLEECEDDDCTESIEDEIEQMKEKIDDAQNEIDDTVPEQEPTEEMIEEKVEEMVDDRMNDPRSVIEEFGLDLREYVDTDKMAQGLVDSDGWGVMNGYDGSYNSVYLDQNSQTYYVMRVQ